jgi:hypothetical protein
MPVQFVNYPPPSMPFAPQYYSVPPMEMAANISVPTGHMGVPTGHMGVPLKDQAVPMMMPVYPQQVYGPPGANFAPQPRGQCAPVPWQQPTMTPLHDHTNGWYQQAPIRPGNAQIRHGDAPSSGGWSDRTEQQVRADALVGSDQRRWVTMPLETFESEIVELAFSRNGSLYLQTKLSSITVEESGAPVTTADHAAFTMILHELSPVLDKVMQDKYGSHLTRWLVQLGTPDQRILMWNSLSDSKLVETCCTHYGKWTIQELITAAKTVACENLAAAVAAMTRPLPTSRVDPRDPAAAARRKPIDEFDSMVTLLGAKPTPQRFEATELELKTIQSSLSVDDIVTLFRERDGAHIIKAFVLFMAPKDRQFIYDAAEAQVVRLATDRYGGATLQRLLEAEGSKEQRMQLAGAITQKAAAMVSDAHGNYILQHVLTMGTNDNDINVKAAVDTLRGQFLKLAKHKFGSNVVEKCVQSGQWALVEVANELLSTGTRAQQQAAAAATGTVTVSGAGTGGGGRGSNTSASSTRRSASHGRGRGGTSDRAGVARSTVVNVSLGGPGVTGGVTGGVESLLGDRYGNYVIQAIIQRCDLDGELLLILRDRVAEYDQTHKGWSKSVMGRRVIQKLMKRMQKKLKRMKVAEKEKEAAAAVDHLLDETDSDRGGGGGGGGNADTDADDNTNANGNANGGGSSSSSDNGSDSSSSSSCCGSSHGFGERVSGEEEGEGEGGSESEAGSGSPGSSE